MGAKINPDEFWRGSPLKGVTKTKVAAFLSSKAPPGTLTQSRLQTLTELKLRTAGLRVLTAAEDRDDPEVNPTVEVSVVAIRATTDSGTNSLGYAFSTRIAVWEYRVAPRNGALAPMELWANAYLNVADVDRTAQEVERVVTQLLDEFVNEWLKANPKH